MKKESKMKKIVASIALASTMLMAGGSIAPIVEAEPCPEFTPSGYIGVSGTYSEFTYKYFPSIQPVEVTYDDDTIGFQGQIGYDIFGQDNWVFGVEARAGYATVDAFDATYIAAYVKPQYNFDGGFGIYGLLGYGQTTFTVSDYLPSGVKLSATDDTDDFTYGAGIRYFVNEKLEVFGDYVVLPDYEVGYDKVDSDIVSIGLNYHF